MKNTFYIKSPAQSVPFYRQKHPHFCIQTTMFSTRIQVYNILYLDSPHFSRILAGDGVIYCGSDWGTFGSSSNSKLCQSTPSFLGFVCYFFLLLFIFTPFHLSFSFSPPCSFPRSSVPVDGDVKYLNALCCLGTMLSSRWAVAAQTPMYANLYTKQPRMFSI